MRLIVLAAPSDMPKEQELVNSLFDNGLEHFHLRKNYATEKQTEDFLIRINPKFMNRISLHQHFKLAQKFNVGGLHLKEEYFDQLEEAELNDLIQHATLKKLRISLSLHSVEKLKEVKARFNYIFLSPVFPSISKKGYSSTENLIKLPANINQEIIALGGINEERLPELSGKGFSGAGILGAIWEEFEVDSEVQNAVSRYQKIRNAAGAIEWKQKDLIF